MGESLVFVRFGLMFVRLQEVKTLEELSTALYDLVRLHALSYVKWAILKRTVMSTLMAGLSPLLLLKIGRVVGMSQI